MKTLIRLSVLILLCVLVLENQSFAQVLISSGSGEPDSSALLEIRSETGGLLIPNIEITKVGNDVVATNIPSPADGLLIFHDGFLSDGTTESNLPKGLWYYDATASGGKWMIYSQVGSIYSSSLDNFGELFEINDMGNGTMLTVNDAISIPWASASEGHLGPGFLMFDDTTALAEDGTTSVLVDQLFISTNKAYYTADVSTTLTTGTSGNIISGQLFVNDVQAEAIFFRHAFQSSGEYVNCATSGIILLEPNSRVDFRFKSSTAVEIIYIEHLNMKLTKIGDY